MKNPISLRILYLLTKISYWGLLVLIGIVVFAGIIMLTLDPQLMELGFPFDLYHSQEVVYLNSETPTPVEVDFIAESIDIPVKYLDRPTMSYVLGVSLIWLSGLTIIVRFFKRFMRKVLDGQTFNSESIVLIKKAALGLVILEAIDLMDSAIGHFYVLRHFDLKGLEHHFSCTIYDSWII